MVSKPISAAEPEGRLNGNIPGGLQDEPEQYELRASRRLGMAGNAAVSLPFGGCQLLTLVLRCATSGNLAGREGFAEICHLSCEEHGRMTG